MASARGVRSYARGSEARPYARGSLVLGGLAMLAVSLALFWLPLLGPLAGGFVGGWIIRQPGVAVAVALLPAIAMSVLILTVLAAFDLPLLGTLAGATTFLVVAVQDVPLLVGAYVGGALRD